MLSPSDIFDTLAIATNVTTPIQKIQTYRTDEEDLQRYIFSYVIPTSSTKEKKKKKKVT